MTPEQMSAWSTVALVLVTAVYVVAVFAQNRRLSKQLHDDRDRHRGDRSRDAARGAFYALYDGGARPWGVEAGITEAVARDLFARLMLAGRLIRDSQVARSAEISDRVFVTAAFLPLTWWPDAALAGINRGLYMKAVSEIAESLEISLADFIAERGEMLGWSRWPPYEGVEAWARSHCADRVVDVAVMDDHSPPVS